MELIHQAIHLFQQNYCSQHNADNEISSSPKEDRKFVRWVIGTCIAGTAALVQATVRSAGTFIWISLTGSLGFIALLEWLSRLVILPGEIKYQKQYSGTVSMSSIVKNVLQPNNTTFAALICAVISALSISIVVPHPVQVLLSAGFFANMMVLISVFMFTKTILRMSDSPWTKCQFLRGDHGLDYGSGMAYSYFYGYLNIILPNRGDDNVGLRENIERYEANQNIEIPVKKLFILIPFSMYFPPSLVDSVENDRIRAASNLETLIRNVAGVHERHYKNSVYKVRRLKPDGSFGYVYVVAEGATPLHTLYQTIHAQGPACTPEIREHKIELVRQFFQTLSRILNCYRECRGTYELIYYNDLDHAVNIADLLLERIDLIVQQQEPH